MARARNPNRKKAFQIYEKHKGDIKLVDIAKQLNEKDNQIRKWKSLDNWDLQINGNAPKKNGNAPQKKRNAPQKKRNAPNKQFNIAYEFEEPSQLIDKNIIDELMENKDLSNEERLFCVYYSQSFNQTRSYMQVNKCSYEAAAVMGNRWLKKDKINKQIDKLVAAQCNNEILKRSLLQKYLDIAYADIGNYVHFGTRKEKVWEQKSDGTFKEVIDPNTGEQLIRTRQFLEYKDSNLVDTSLIQEVSNGKDGLKIKLIDKTKALEFLRKHSKLSDADINNLQIKNLKLKNEKLENEIERLRPQEIQEKAYHGIPSNMIAPCFSKVVFDIENSDHLEYVFPGGRGSTKSSFVGLEVIDIIMKNENMHACICRQIKDTLRTSVYQQVLWCLRALDLEDEFECTVSPLEITRKATGQKIYFRGADNPDSIKSIKVPFGYIGVLWYEELDQFHGEEAVRKIQQSIIRGGDKAYIFKSFNPPKSAINWANKYIKIPKKNMLVTWSNYQEVPSKWLGKAFIEEAEFLKEVNPDAYENEYMGVANGNGGNIFDNVVIQEITDEEIKRFDRIYNGVDWGWYPDPWAFNRCYFDAARRDLYIFDEARANKMKDRDTAKLLVEKHNITPYDKITCDSAENKSIANYKDYGLYARGAIKGAGSVEESMKWLQSLNRIIIDRVRCPNSADEFLNYEYERDKEGNVISGYPDKDNHNIDAIRYAIEEVWRRRRQ